MRERAVARAQPNLALVKYFGKRNAELNLPLHGSLGVTVNAMISETAVTWSNDCERFVLNGVEQVVPRVMDQLFERMFARASHQRRPLLVESHNNFPTAAGLASSASGYAALVRATAAILDWPGSEAELGVEARRCSGSATRALHGGFVLWHKGVLADGSDSIAHRVESPLRLAVVACLVDDSFKAVFTTQAMQRVLAQAPLALAEFSRHAERALVAVEGAVTSGDFEALVPWVEASADGLHDLLEGLPDPVIFRTPQSHALMAWVRAKRQAGRRMCYTLDAGPNVKILAPADMGSVIAAEIDREFGIATIANGMGEGARLVC